MVFLYYYNSKFTAVICYLLNPDETICGFCPSDFDECSLYGTCSQTCSNTEGSYTCSCVEGYLSQPDNRSCKAKNGESANICGTACNPVRTETACMFCPCSSRRLFLMLVSRSSAGGPSACSADRQLPEHPGHLPERHRCAQPAVNQHQTNHGHGLPVRRGDCLLDPCGRSPLIHTPQMCQDPQSEELHRGESDQHLPQPAP